MQKNIFFLAFLCVIVAMSCNPVSRIVTGEDAYQYKRYPEAITLLEAEIEKSKITDEQAKKSFWIGESYTMMNEAEKAISWYRKAYELSPNRISLEAYANAVFKAQQYTNAKKLFTKLTKDYGKSEFWENAIKSCDAALVWMRDQDANQYIIKKVKLNSDQSDFSPVFFDEIMVFTSDREESKGDEYHWTGNQFMDFYRTGENAKLDNLLFKINSPYNESSITFNQKLDHVVYTQCGTSKEDESYEHCRLIEGIWDEEDQNWMSFKMLSFCKDNVDYGHPTFFNEDRGIIFSSNDENGIGGHDLWVSYKDQDEWSKPVLLPAGINTTGDEKFPVMQGDSLFYSSDGKVGMGGLDIYVTKWVAPDGWTSPVNLKPPVNSGGDDFGFVFDPFFKKSNSTTNKFFISSNRKGSRQDDIYEFIEKRIFSPDDSVAKEPAYKIVIEGKILEHIYEIEGDPNSRIMGTRPLKESLISIAGDNEYPELNSDDSGEFAYVISEEGPYRFIASKEDYLTNSQFIDIKLTEKDKRLGGKTYLVQIVLDPIVYNKEIVMSDIYYDFDKWDIRKDAEPSLNSLAELLLNNPMLNIELASHTDCRGLEIYNAELSQRRAQSAVTYLENAGVESRRMKAVGYGKQKPAVNCVCDVCTEEQHQANRRTSFTILK